MIEITPNNYYIGFWFKIIPPPYSRYGFVDDIHCCIWRANSLSINGEEKADWTLSYRFRYTKDPSLFNSVDEKSGYIVKMPNLSEMEAIGVVEKMLSLVNCEPKFEFYELKCTGDIVIEKLQTAPPDWMHMQAVTTE
jgi:hypothetical protein